MIKRASSTYQPGRRSAAWIKAVVRRRNPMVVGGFIPGGGRHTGGIGTLLVGAHNDTGELDYAGHVGTGLSDRLRRTLLVRLGELTCADSPFTGPAALCGRPRQLGEASRCCRCRVPPEIGGIASDTTLRTLEHPASAPLTAS